MTISFKAFSTNIIEANAIVNVSIAGVDSIIGGKTTMALGSDVSAFGDGAEADGSNTNTGMTTEGMTTDALYFGDPGDDEQMETIYKTALYRQQEAQQRWKKLKNWIKSVGVDPSIQSKIASPTAVLSINTPAIMKGHHYYKDLKDLKNKMKKGKG